MNILILTHNFPKDDKERKDAGYFIYETALNLSKKHNVSVYCPNYFGKKSKFDFNVFWFPRLGNKKKLANLNFYNPLSFLYFLSFIASGLFFLPNQIKKNKTDIVICYWSFPNGIFALFAKIFFKKRYITFSLGSDIFVYGNKFPISFINKIILRNADACIGNSRKICDSIKKIAKVKCVFLSSSTNFTYKKIAKLKNSFDKKKFNYLFVGRLEYVKAPDLLLDVFKSLIKINKNIFLHIVGDGEMRSELERFTKKNSLNKYVHFYGNINNESVLANFYKNSNCLVIPSRSESMPFVAIEASQFNLPIVASNVGDLKYFVNKYKVGLIFEKENMDDFLNSLNKIKNFKIHNNSFDKVKKEYSFNQSMKRLEKIIYEIK